MKILYWRHVLQWRMSSFTIIKYFDIPKYISFYFFHCIIFFSIYLLFFSDCLAIYNNYFFWPLTLRTSSSPRIGRCCVLSLHTSFWCLHEDVQGFFNISFFSCSSRILFACRSISSSFSFNFDSKTLIHCRTPVTCKHNEC